MRSRLPKVRKPLVIFFSASALALTAIIAAKLGTFKFVTGISVDEVKGRSAASAPEKKSAAGFSSLYVPPPDEISLDEALRDTDVKVRIPSYIPAGAKLVEVQRRKERMGAGKTASINLYYELGEEWIEVGVFAAPQRPDYEKAANPVMMARRVLPDGREETVVLNSSAAVAEPKPDGSMEPRGVDKNWLLTIKGMTAHYVESKGIRTMRPGGKRELVFPRDFAAIFIWKDGMKYRIGGSNISRDEILKIAESMF